MQLAHHGVDKRHAGVTRHEFIQGLNRRSLRRAVASQMLENLKGVVMQRGKETLGSIEKLSAWILSFMQRFGPEANRVVME